MRRLSGYGPSLIVLVTAALVLFAGPYAVRQLTYEYTKTQIIQAHRSLDNNDVLGRINQAYRDIGAMVEPSVVHISAQFDEKDALGFQPRQSLSTGSGWIYDELGHVITNNHVIANAEKIDVQLYNGEIRQAMLVGADPTTDIAVLKIAPGRLHPACIADMSEPVKQGDLVFAFGSPFDFRFSMSSGVVSGKDRSVNVIRDESGGRLGYENFIQVDAAINPGNSGGPLTDYRGRVIGMNTAIATGRRTSLEEGQFAGIGLAIPIEMIQPAVTQLIARGFVEKGFLGVSVDRDFGPQEARMFGFTGFGVRLMGVEPGGPADMAGVKPNDIVTHVNGRPVASVAQLQSHVSSMLPGETARLTLWRYDRESGVGTTLEIPVPLKRLDMVRAAGILPPDQDRNAIPAIGIAKMSTNTPEIAAKFDAPFRQGVILERLVPGASFGFRISPGTTITAVKDRPVRNVEDFIDALRSDCDLRLGVTAAGFDPSGRAIPVLVLRVQN